MKKLDTIDPLRRKVVGSLGCGALALGVASITRASEERAHVEVWKSPTCGCCNDWIIHMEDHGFSVASFNDGNSEVRKRAGIPVRFGSCHTALVGGYAIEGHVPARDVIRLLQEKPDAVGLSVPAMPRGSPGMDGPAYRGVKDPYDVLLIEANGTARVFQSYRRRTLD